VNTQGDWERNIKVEGSLMMRPIFRKTNFDPNAVVGIQKNILNNIQVYPNPAKDLIHIKGNFDSVELISISGQNMLIGINNESMNISGIPNGIYILKIEKENLLHTQKIIIQH